MKTLSSAPLALVCATGFSVGALSYQPDSDLALLTTFESSLSLEITEMTRGVSIDGEEHPMPDLPAPDFTMTETESISYTDVVTMEDGVPTSIQRSFSVVGNHMAQEVVDPAGEEHGSTLEGESELEGATVKFVWDAEDEDYTASFGEDSEDLDEEMLTGLIARADFSGFLPDEEVSEGDDWDVPTSAYITITHLCGDLQITREDDEDDGGEEYNESFDDNLEGEFTATWKETVEEDGERYAVIEIQGELSTVVESEDEVSFNDVSGTETSEDAFEFELVGELRWNLAGNHASALELAGALEMNRATTQEFDMNGRALLVTEGTTFEGLVKYSVTIE